MNVTVEAAWAAGFLLASLRIGAFVVASPILSRTVPAAGRVAFVVALSLFFATPMPGTLGLASLVTAAAVNVGLGVVLGWMTGLIFHLFAVAGSLLDDSSGLRASAIVDPVTGVSTPVFSQTFRLIALTVFLVIGGDRLLIRGLDATFDAIPLDGSIDLVGGIPDAAVALIGSMLVAAVELAIPAVAALFAAEVVLAIAARLAPQANVFLVGLPVKVLTAMATVVFVVVLMPESFQGTMRVIERTFIDIVHVVAG